MKNNVYRALQTAFILNRELYPPATSFIDRSCYYWFDLPLWLHTYLSSMWHRFNEMLEMLLRDFGPVSHSCFRFVSCTSLMGISHSITSQTCSIRLISGECGGQWSTGNLLPCSRIHFEMIWALWNGVLSL